jgi:hypothetical protein
MRIRFNVCVEDFVFFNRFNFDESRQAQNAVRRNQAVFAITALVLGAIVSYRTGLWWLFVPLGAAAAAGYAVLLRRILSSRLDRTTREVISKPENRLELGEHEVEILADGIRARDAASEGKTYWKGLTRLVRGGEYALVFTGTSTALVIRKAAVFEGDVEAFLDEIERRMPGGADHSRTSMDSSHVAVSPGKFVP